MGSMASQISSLTIVYSTVYSGADQRRHQSSASLAIVRGIHQDRWIPSTNGQQRGKCFHLMTSSYSYLGLLTYLCVLISKVVLLSWFTSLRPRQNWRHFADNVLKCNFLNENVWIPVEISLKFIPKSLINNIPALVQIMVWRRTGDRPLYEPMMTRFNDAYMRHSASMS